MKITFDQAKRDAAFAERGLAFEDAEIVFEGDTLTVEDTRFDYGESRYQTIGFLEGRMVMVVWTPRGEDRRAAPVAAGTGGRRDGRTACGGPRRLPRGPVADGLEAGWTVSLLAGEGLPPGAGDPDQEDCHVA